MTLLGNYNPLVMSLSLPKLSVKFFPVNCYFLQFAEENSEQLVRNLHNTVTIHLASGKVRRILCGRNIANLHAVIELVNTGLELARRFENLVRVLPHFPA